jgi:hypothetical protein
MKEMPGLTLKLECILMQLVVPLQAFVVLIETARLNSDHFRSPRLKPRCGFAQIINAVKHLLNLCRNLSRMQSHFFHLCRKVCRVLNHKLDCPIHFFWGHASPGRKTQGRAQYTAA